MNMVDSQTLSHLDLTKIMDLPIESEAKALIIYKCRVK